MKNQAKTLQQISEEMGFDTKSIEKEMKRRKISDEEK